MDGDASDGCELFKPHLVGHDRRVVFSRVGKVNHPHPSILSTISLIVTGPAIITPVSTAAAPEQPSAAVSGTEPPVCMPSPSTLKRAMAPP